MLLRGLTGKMVEPAWFKVDRLAGEAYVWLASIHTGPSKATQEQPSTTAIGPVGPDREIAQARERVKNFEGKIAAIQTQIAAFQQSLTQAIVSGSSMFKPRDINKAISKLNADKKELELRRDDWQLMLESALRRAPGQPQQTKPPYSPTLVEKGRTESADSHDTEEASIHGISVPISNSDSLLSSSPESMPGNQARRPQPDKSKLPAKTTDLSKYLEGAELTERQRECFSLKFEYGLKVSEIVIRLGLSRKTVDEHIAAAKRRIEWSQLKERQKANSARINPGD